MGVLGNFQYINQKGPNDCWLACAAMIETFRRKKDTKGSYSAVKLDVGNVYDDLLGIYNSNKKHPYSANSVPQESASVFLIDYCGYPGEKMGTDGWAIPTFEEIKEQIDKKERLFLCFVDSAPPQKASDNAAGRYKANRKGDNGHWIIICGYDEAFRAQYIYVADPDQGGTKCMPYNFTEYRDKNNSVMYWWSTTYCDYK
ncbi:MAG: C39 family peptidase [Clostridiales bacterium]|nr:C39 family peptidase [Clostridiales bacterium]